MLQWRVGFREGRTAILDAWFHPPGPSTGLSFSTKSARLLHKCDGRHAQCFSPILPTVSSALGREVEETGRQLSEPPEQGLTAGKLIQIRTIFRVVTAALMEEPC